MPSSPTAPFTALRARTRVLVAVLAALAALALAALAADAVHARVVARLPTHLLDVAAVARSDQRVTLLAHAVAASLVVGAVAFVCWTRAAYQAALATGVVGLRLSPRAAAWSFVVPVVQLARPVLALAALARALDREALPEPPPRPRRDGEHGYRDHAAEAPPPLITGPAPPLAVWWALWLASRVVEGVAAGVAAQGNAGLSVATRLDVAADALLAGAALAAIQVVRGLDARLRERARRARTDDAP